MSAEKPDGFITRFRGKRIEQVIAMVLVPILLIVALLLPPVSLGERLFSAGYTSISASEGGTVLGPAGATLQIPVGALEKRSRIRLKALDEASLSGLSLGNPDFFADIADKEMIKVEPDSSEHLALQSLPAEVVNFAPFYHIDVRGDQPTRALFSAQIPYELANTERADLFGWDGQEWRWLPSEIADGGLTLNAELDTLPEMLTVAQAEAMGSRFSVSISKDDQPLPDDLAPTYINLEGFVLKDDGGVDTKGALAPSDVPTGATVVLSISNIVDGTVQSDIVDNMIVSPEARAEHMANVVELVSEYGAAGVEIAYGNISPALSQDFSTLVAELGQALHAENKFLAVRVDTPVAAGPTWDTGAYDWRALSRTADLIRLPAMLSLDSYADGGEMDALLSWATRMVDRRRIDLVIDTCAHVMNDRRVEPISYASALGILAGEIETDTEDEELPPGKVIRLGLASENNVALEYHADARTYWFTPESGQSAGSTVLLENAASVSRKLQYIDRYALGGVSISAMLNGENDPDIMHVVRTFRDEQPSEPSFALVWTAESPDGQVLVRQVKPLDNASWAWQAPRNPGSYVLRASVSDDGGETALGSGAQVKVVVPDFTPTPTATPEPTATPTVEPTEEAEAEPEPTQEADPAEPTPTPQPAAPPVAAAGSAGRGFGYGIQVHMIDQGDIGRILDHVQAIGFNWVKQQVEWKLFNPAPGQYNWGALDQIVEACNARGIRIMFSVVKAPAWARPGHSDFSVEGPPADPQTYADFVGAMANRYRGRVHAYEIWNEQNLHYEWGNEPLDPARYMQLLRLAYNAIKSQDPNATVVSGALTPTGAPAPWAMDDFTYLELMYQHGLKNYCDAVGAHPSGYNVPPTVSWPGFNDPSAGFRGPFDGPGAVHHSWSFQSTMTGYRNIMARYGDGGKRIWPTEFGWASVENLGVAPAAGYEYAADNSEGEQAQYIVQAYQMARSWGWVGPMFLWNLNFAPVAGNAWEGSAFSIVRGDWSPRPAFHALQNMAK
jgi:hypothetical protein